MKTLKEYAEDAAGRLKKSKNGSTPTKKEKSKSPKSPGNAPKTTKKPRSKGK